MVGRHLLSAIVLFGLTTAYTVDPPTTAAADTIEDCTNWIVGESGNTCTTLATDWAITQAQLLRYNPSLASSCTIVIGQSYCVEENWGLSPTTSTSSSASATTTAGNGITTPTPTQSGMIANCNKFHFVEAGQSCQAILDLYSLTLATFYSWNTGVGEGCNGMWASVYVCVGVVGGGTVTTSVSSTTTSAGNGISTPTPTQSGMISTCNKFHFVESGQSCQAILDLYSLTLATFYSWNTGVGEGCNGMWASVYVCVGVIGGGTVTTSSTTTSTTSTTTSAGNGVSTPTPTQPGMVSNCDKFYFVNPGTACSTVLSANGLTIAQLYALNSGVNADCSGLWASVYVCVHQIGAPTTTLQTITTTTSSGNGVATPTPYMPGMVANCKKFYLVVSGDGCDVISTKTGASAANIISWNPQVGSSCNVWLGYYICVGV